MLRFLFLGDISGDTGLSCVKRLLPGLRERLAVDVCVANVENVANGLGVTKKCLDRLRRIGVDFFTSGNHIWDKDEVFKFIDLRDDLIRPANYPPGTPGHGHRIVSLPLPDGRAVRVLYLNLLGRLFLARVACPFEAAATILEAEKERHDLAFVDFHAEATAEKVALGRFLDGRVTGVFGTHTHVPTNDARILPGGTAYISDLGMCGAEDSVIGCTIGPVLDAFTRRRYRPWGVAHGPAVLNAALVTVDEASRRALAIEPVIAREPVEA